jgi:hypothetical protein
MLELKTGTTPLLTPTNKGLFMTSYEIRKTWGMDTIVISRHTTLKHAETKFRELQAIYTKSTAIPWTLRLMKIVSKEVKLSASHEPQPEQEPAPQRLRSVVQAIREQERMPYKD